MGVEFSGDGDGAGQTSGESTDGRRAATARLQTVLAGVATGASSRDDLRDAAIALVQQLRRDKLPPENMLLHIKQVLGEAGLRPTYASALPEFASGESSLYSELIAWCIKEYYRDGS